MTKNCRKCHAELPLSSFRVHPKRGYVDASCRACESTYRAAYYLAHRDRIRAQVTARQRGDRPSQLKKHGVSVSYTESFIPSLSSASYARYGTTHRRNDTCRL